MAIGKKTGGRTKGTPNKTTKALKDMILGALEDVGGQKYLNQQAKENPVAFMTLLGKVVPSEIKGGLSLSATARIEVISEFPDAS